MSVFGPGGGGRRRRGMQARGAGGRCCRRCFTRPARSPPRATDPSAVPAASDVTASAAARAQLRMLQQMSSPAPPPSALAGEVENLLRPFEDRLYGDASSKASSDAVEDIELLPECKIKRNYNCAKCTFYTQNPRTSLIHARDVHFEKLKIYECSSCVYASRDHQKLVRHIKMVHDVEASSSSTKVEEEIPKTNNERMEHLLEEVEEYDDTPIDLDDYIEEYTVDDEADDKEAPGSTDASDSKFFACTKCSYTTHIKSRYKKHIKYHSMPMTKCTICEFRTPYKWNLDRHMKNHGGTGSFLCWTCNFTADIKQSLTVHEMNHHTSAAGYWHGYRRRNRVGGSDILLAESSLIEKEEGSDDSRSSEMGLQITEKEMANSNSDSNDVTVDIDSKGSDAVQTTHEGNGSQTKTSDDERKSRKIPRPIPQLIPLGTSTPNQNKTTGEPPAKKLKESPPNNELNENPKQIENLPADITLIPVNNAKETIGRKKNESFFDKLKERLLTETGEKGSLNCKNCGFESKCLSEHSVHEKNCTVQPNRTTNSVLHQHLSSTRCQNCRHRCKSSADLFNHMKTCQQQRSEKDDIECIKMKNQKSEEASSSTTDKDIEKHPMENVVFVWNNINQDTSKFETPLGISIEDPSTGCVSRNYDNDITDEQDTVNLSPGQAGTKKVFKCPHCPFWATTASRFHVHIVGHLNKKPFECSSCHYKSNWRWDITKHIKLKSARGDSHNNAEVWMTDPTGKRNYMKYNKFLATTMRNENGLNEFHYLDHRAAADASLEITELVDVNTAGAGDVQPLNLQTLQSDESGADKFEDNKKNKKTLWKCKKCNYRDPSKEALLEHVRGHSKLETIVDDTTKVPKPEIPDPADLAYRCGHCNQLSNWKHVIQRHCRLKHGGIIKVITTVKPKPDETQLNIQNDTCTKCPFKSSDRKTLMSHMQMHQPSVNSIFKCYFCPFFVKNESELIQHLVLHGVNDPADYISKAMGCKSPLPEGQPLSTSLNSNSNKRHKCTECPYETNSKSQYMYHEQFHKHTENTPYKCQECNYSVSKRHLLHQHMRVHGIFTRKCDDDLDNTSSHHHKSSDAEKVEYSINLDEIPYVWVSAKNEFHKMYKCRYCSYVNSQECRIPTHEKIHCTVFENSDITIYKCLECKFTCDSAWKLADHSKTHAEIYGRIYCPVEFDITDEEQVIKLRKVNELEKANMSEDTSKDGGSENVEIKVLYFCHKCPARFFADSELRLHDKFHDLASTHKCIYCEYSVNEEDQLTEHLFLHSDEYNTKTKMLKFLHNRHPAHSGPQLEITRSPDTAEVKWIVSYPRKNYETGENNKKCESKHVPKQYFCKECPAKFFKSSALSYHANLHGGEGDHKCKKCSYTVKNVGNLAKHELLHEDEGKASNCDYESGEDNDFKHIPLSGTDLFQRKTEAQKKVLSDKDNQFVKPNDHFPPILHADPQFGYLMHGNPEFIYPTYLKNGRQREKRYKCHKCPSAFEKREQYKIHLSLHGSKQRYKCELCDYSVKYYANYVQHMRKHQMNDAALAERNKRSGEVGDSNTVNDNKEDSGVSSIKLAIKTIPKGIPKSDFQQFSISDQQTLRLLQRRRSMSNIGKDANASDSTPAKERKLHLCLLCPYTNQRLDSLSNHYKRHDDTDAYNQIPSHKCSFCDLAVLQSHLLKDHLKSHFNYPKHLIPECYVANEGVKFTITKLDADDEVESELTIDMDSKNFLSKDEKIYVKIKTGEIAVE